MEKKYILLLLTIVPIILTVQSVDGRTLEEVNSVVQLKDTYKIFEDGITYTNDCIEVEPPRLFKSTNIKGYGCAIIHEGVEYPCEFDRMHGGVLTPMCVEIILRSIP